jgi:hypothetical protein
MFVKDKDKDGDKLFSHGGSNYGYLMNFVCVPEKNEIKIYMLCYNSKYRKQVKDEKKRLQL